MKYLVYALFGMLLSLFGISVVNEPVQFFVLLGLVLIIDYLPDPRKL